MSDTETQQTNSEVSSSAESQSVASVNPPKKSLLKIYIGAAILVVLIILGVMYQLEKEGRSPTNIFGSIIENQRAGAVVAVVNGEKIINSELDISISQFTQMATFQGVDVNDAGIQAEIKDQALDVLINTELLKQSAAEKNITVSDAQVDEKIEAVKTDMGGEEALLARMEELNISYDKLRADIKDEILIQTLLEDIFAEKGISVSEEEITALYEGSGGEEAGLPPLEEVREQVEAQVRATKEQQAIDEYLSEMRAAAEIEVVS